MLQTMYTVGAVVGQPLSCFSSHTSPCHGWFRSLTSPGGYLPSCSIEQPSFAELAAYRFLVGWFEVLSPIPDLPQISYYTSLLGGLLPSNALYLWRLVSRRRDRAPRQVFYVGLTLGTLTAGLIQAGASARLDGVNRPRRLALDVYHMLRHHHTGGDPRVRHPAGHA